MSNKYDTEVQWGGDAAPWHPNGVFVIGGRDNQRAVGLWASSDDGGQSFRGMMRYAGEGNLGFRATNVGGNTYRTEVQWGGDAAPWHANGEFVIGGRDNQRCVKIEIESGDDGVSFHGIMVYSGEGPIGLRARQVSDPVVQPRPVPSFSPQGAFVSPILNVADVAATIAWFRGFGWECIYAYGEPLGYAVLRLGWGLIVAAKDSQGLRGGAPVGPGSGDDAGATWENWWMATPAEVDLMYQLAVANGATVVSPPVDTPWGIRELRIAHPDGHVFRVNAVLS